MLTDRVKIALIGAGGWGLQHARVFASRSDVGFCAVVGWAQEKIRARAAEFGVRASTDITEMLNRERPDLSVQKARQDVAEGRLGDIVFAT